MRTSNIRLQGLSVSRFDMPVVAETKPLQADLFGAHNLRRARGFGSEGLKLKARPMSCGFVMVDDEAFQLAKQISV